MSNKQWITKNGRTTKRGLFVSGIWHCDCDTRLPAEKFQVKKGGNNFGRWFYTCQQPQPKRCGFFLWADDAKVREEAAVLNNSKTEPGTADNVKIGAGGRLRSDHEPPKTPKRQVKITEPITPVSRPKSSEKVQNRSDDVFKEEDSFDWSSSAEDDLADFADKLERVASTRNPEYSPRKALKTSASDSPGNRVQRDTQRSSTVAADSPGRDLSTRSPKDEAVFTTPTPSRTGPSDAAALLSPTTTPPVRRQLFATAHSPTNQDSSSADARTSEPGALALEALSLLSPVRASLPRSTERALIALLNKHELRTTGIEKGRDVARAALQAKEKKATELQQRITALEAERETSRTVIQHLKTDIATSPKRPRRPAAPNMTRDSG